jgi:hypothetical protein
MLPVCKIHSRIKGHVDKYATHLSAFVYKQMYVKSFRPLFDD